MVRGVSHGADTMPVRSWARRAQLTPVKLVVLLKESGLSCRMSEGIAGPVGQVL